MKKNGIKVIFFTITLAVFSCKKESKIVPFNMVDESTETVSESLPYYEEDSYGDKASAVAIDLKHLVLNFPEFGDINCFKPAENCLPTVIVTASVTASGSSSSKNSSFGTHKNGVNESNSVYIAYKRLEEALKGKSKSNSKIKSFFSSKDWKILFPRLRKDTAKKIAEGELKLVKKRATKEQGTDLFIVLRSTSNSDKFASSEVIVAMPIQLK